jgi:hypothetical protein
MIVAALAGIFRSTALNNLLLSRALKNLPFLKSESYDLFPKSYHAYPFKK